MRGTTLIGSARRRSTLRGSDRGSVIIIAMMFILIFLGLGIALYWLVISQIRSTETERTDVKSFNVAEAGIDAGMLALKLSWPSLASESTTVDETLLRTTLREDNVTLWLASRSADPEGDFVRIDIYDNSAGGTTVSVPPDEALRETYDRNVDGKMYVDATANVDNDRHRILILAERQKWDLTFPRGTALFANLIDSSGQLFEIGLRDGSSPIYYDIHDPTSEGVDVTDPAITTMPTGSTFDSIFTDSLRRALKGMAMLQGTYFTDDELAEDFLFSGAANGKVIYIETDSAVDIGGNSAIGSITEPVVIILDTPSGSANNWDMVGNANLYGVLVCLGDSTLKGTCSIYGAMYVSGTLINKGNGSDAELYYSDECIMNLNRQYVISVNIVPNTWEEYAVD